MFLFTMIFYLSSHMYTFQRAFCPVVNKITDRRFYLSYIIPLFKRLTSIKRPVFKVPRVAA